jgi:hypothetical protein
VASILLHVSLVLLAFKLLLASYTVADLPPDGGLSAADAPAVAGVHAVTSVHAIDGVPAISIITAIQRWEKAPIDQSSDTDLIFGLYRSISRLISSTDFCIYRLYRSLLSSDSLIDQYYFDFCIKQMFQGLLSTDS